MIGTRSALIVGAGVFGASLADELAGRGWAVTLVEQFSPGDVRSSSGGESRVFRFSHGSDAFYADMARRGADLWADLQATSREELFVRCGVVWFAHQEAGWESQSHDVVARAGVRAERLSAAQLGALFPDVNVDDLDFALYEPDAGVLHARRAVQALVRRAVCRGTQVLYGTASPNGTAVEVNGRAVNAEHVVWACGPWLARLFPGVVDLRVTKQDVFFFGAPPEWRAPSVPAWVDYDLATYGLGDLDGRGVKCAPDLPGTAIDPGTSDREASPDNYRNARAYLARRFPSLAQAPLVGTRTCQYSLTPDNHFIADRHPGCERWWLLGGGSGHGFKHGPALAEHVADVLENHREATDPRFAIGPRRRGTDLGRPS